MAEIPKRDITGDCDEGECRDRVKEGEKQWQQTGSTANTKSTNRGALKADKDPPIRSPSFLPFGFCNIGAKNR